MRRHGASTPAGARPTTIAVPPGRSASQARRIVSGRPRPRRRGRLRRRSASRTRRAASGPASTTSVAPARARARASRDRGRRPRCGGRPPAGRRPRPAGRPRRSPTTHTRVAHLHAAALRTAPTPVTTPQPEQGRLPSGRSSGSGMALAARPRRRLGEAGDHEPSAAAIGRPAGAAARCRRAACRPGRTARGLAQVRPPAPAGRAAAAGRARSRTRRVIARGDVVTPAPTASTMPGALVPEHDRPAVRRRGGRRPGARRSGTRPPRRPAPAPRPRAAGRARAVSTTSGRPASWSTAARIAIGRHATAPRSSASRSGSTPRPGAVRRRDRAVGGDLDRRPGAASRAASADHAGGS